MIDCGMFRLSRMEGSLWGMKPLSPAGFGKFLSGVGLCGGGLGRVNQIGGGLGGGVVRVSWLKMIEFMCVARMQSVKMWSWDSGEFGQRMQLGEEYFVEGHLLSGKVAGNQTTPFRSIVRTVEVTPQVNL